jgi:putative membrane protein
VGDMIVVQVFAGIAALLHVVFFLFESVLFPRPAIQARFHVSPENADAVRPWAFNQGFYNLFLAAGILVGLVMGIRPLVLFPCACMLGAGVVLALTDKRMLRSAVMQAFPPLVALIASFV